MSDVGSGEPIDDDEVVIDAVRDRQMRQRSFRLLRSILRPVRGRVAVLVAVVLAAQACRAVGPLIIAIAVNVSLDDLGSLPARRTLLLCLLLGVVGVGGGVLSALSIRLTSAVSQSALLDLRRRVFLHVQRLTLQFHDRYTSGRAIARQTSDLDDIRELLDTGFSQLISSFVYMAMVTILMVALDPISAVVFIIAMIPVTLVTRWFHVRSRIQYRSSRVASANLIGQFVETMTSMSAIQAFRREGDVVDDHRRVSEAYRDADVRAIGLNGVYDPALVLIGNLTVAVLLALDGHRMLSGSLEVGTLMAAVLYAKRFFQPLEQMARFYNALQAAVASVEKISGLLEEPVGIADPPRPVPLRKAVGEIRLEDVSFGYQSDRPALSHLHVSIPAGQTVALVGGTGAGKSTLVKLVARFYDVTGGAVCLDGIDVRQLSLADLRRNVVFLTQEGYLFSGSIADNIAMGKPGATHAEIEAAARAVGAHEFISGLPQGYDTQIHERGSRISAGQRQLVAFARGFIADPRVLILDEATSALDAHSEAAVQRALEALLRDRTAIVIAHRLTTVEIVDRIIVLDAGQIIEDGSYDELAGADGEFARLLRVAAEATSPRSAG